MTKLLDRNVVSWALYDFGSSAFNTLILTFVFNYFFTQVIAPGDSGTVLWSWSVNLSALIVAVSMPVLGAIADYSGRKKTFLVLFAVQAMVFTCLLFFAGPGDAWAAAALFIVANVGFESANVFYNAFLPEVSTSRTIGRISGIGFMLGYVGGLLSLALGLGMYQTWVPETNYLNTRSTLLLVAAWHLVFALPMFFGVKEKAERRPRPPRGYVREGFHRLAQTIRHIRDFREATKLIVARMVYNDGLVTVISFAAIYVGAVYGMGQTEVLGLGIALNIAAGLGALAFGFVDDRIGGKRTLVLTLVGLIAAGVLGVGTESMLWFWVAAVLIGILMGPNQSASRSLLSKLVPEHKHGEAFGLYAFSGKMSSLMGPATYGTAIAMTGSHRIAMSSIIAFFAIGLLLLLTVREEEGILAADRLNEEFEPEVPEGPDAHGLGRPTA